MNTRSFGPQEVVTVRETVRAEAVEAGLSGHRLDEFVLAVHEVITNAVQHGGGQGKVSLWRDGSMLWCEVADRGPGIPVDRWRVLDPPPFAQPGGRGIWLARRLSDSIHMRNGPRGTTVKLAVLLRDRRK
ncbi:ATP-binding protein [Nonomuraea sp. NPDC050556]|uniref:ATP-binding protein n=1 Tax=Nonomuraea sp. NPDC050556 TaxID=3364369 RepID=UPI0037A7E176